MVSDPSYPADGRAARWGAALHSGIRWGASPKVDKRADLRWNARPRAARPPDERRAAPMAARFPPGVVQAGDSRTRSRGATPSSRRA